jgi:2-polyprenyl-3-methyl-5-hydroxy-6-metoxy-1,4-benzoquinol methylase
MKGKPANNMREEDIRPAVLKDALHKLLLRDRELWLQHKDCFVRVNCPACNSADVKEPIDIRGYSFETCAACETVFYNPRPTIDLLQAYYKQAQSYNFWATNIFPQTEKARRENIFLPLVERISNYITTYKLPTGCLLEIGAGYGIFSEELMLRKLFDRVIAIEPTPALAQICRSKRIETLEKSYEELEIKGGSIDCIASFEVIEHLFSPRHFIQKCNSLLKINGVLVITCPNIKGFDFTVLGLEKAPNIGIEHINMFNTDSIKILVESEGFKVLDISTPGKLDADIVRNMILEGNFNIDDNRFLKLILFEKWDSVGNKFQDFLSSNMLSSNMLVLAIKTA